MKATGGCYCGALRYSIDGAAEAMLQCHCRECQYITGGNPNVAAVFALEDFRYISGTPSTFARSDLEASARGQRGKLGRIGAICEHGLSLLASRLALPPAAVVSTQT